MMVIVSTVLCIPVSHYGLALVTRLNILEPHSLALCMIIIMHLQGSALSNGTGHTAN